MPVYTYRCDNCGVQFERQQSFSEAPLVRCPECSKKTLRKVYTPVGIVFKGSGFYATDHRSPSGTSRHGANTKPNEGDAKSSSAEKSDSSASTASSSETKSSSASES